MFSDVLESFRTCLDLFGCVQMCSDAIGCISVRWEALGHFGNFRIFSNFSDDSSDFWFFSGLGGLTFIDVLRVGGLLLLGLTIGRSH